MYRMILVDDEEIVRNGLSYFLDWHALGFELTAAFEDGKEAIEFLSKERVDVILTDIHMAEIDGLTLAQWVFQQKLQTKLVLISGHQQFDYAKRAIEYNVNHYLLKPTKYEEMVQVFTQLKAELDEESKQRALQQKELLRFNKVIPLLHEQFIANLANGEFATNESKAARAALIHFDFDLERTPCCLLNIEFIIEDKQIKEASLTQMIQATLQIFKNKQSGIHYYCIHQTGKKSCLAAISSDQENALSFRRRLELQLQQLSTEIKQLFQFDLYIATQTYYPSLQQLIMNEPQAAAETASGREALSHPLPLIHVDELVSLITIGELSEVHQKFDAIVEELQAVPLTAVHRYLVDLFAQITQALVINGLLDKDIQKNRFDYHMIIEMKALSDIVVWSKQFLSSLSRLMSVQTKTNANQSVELAKQFILEHYHLDISLDEVASHIFLHPIYFSRMFKQYTGMNYIDFLTQVRIQKAIALLESGQHKIYEIPEKVGYKNREYFSRIFKQVTGKSPKQYLIHKRFKETIL